MLFAKFDAHGFLQKYQMYYFPPNLACIILALQIVSMQAFPAVYNFHVLQSHVPVHASS